MIRMIILLFTTSLCHAQTNEWGTITRDTLLLNNGARFVVGEKVQLGYGSNGAKGFEFIHLSPFSAAGPIKLGSNWANATMVVKEFKTYTGKKTGTKVYVVLRGGNLSPYWCDVVAAIDQKEIVVKGISDREGAKSSPVSVADELKKLKDLLDSGALTQEEYNAAKKKLLER